MSNLISGITYGAFFFNTQWFPKVCLFHEMVKAYEACDKLLAECAWEKCLLHSLSL